MKDRATHRETTCLLLLCPNVHGLGRPCPCPQRSPPARPCPSCPLGPHCLSTAVLLFVSADSPRCVLAAPQGALRRAPCTESRDGAAGEGRCMAVQPPENFCGPSEASDPLPALAGRVPVQMPAGVPAALCCPCRPLGRPGWNSWVRGQPGPALGSCELVYGSSLSPLSFR